MKKKCEPYNSFIFFLNHKNHVYIPHKKIFSHTYVMYIIFSLPNCTVVRKIKIVCNHNGFK